MYFKKKPIYTNTVKKKIINSLTIIKKTNFYVPTKIQQKLIEIYLETSEISKYKYLIKIYMSIHNFIANLKVKKLKFVLTKTFLLKLINF